MNWYQKKPYCLPWFMMKKIDTLYQNNSFSAPCFGGAYINGSE